MRMRLTKIGMGADFGVVLLAMKGDRKWTKEHFGVNQATPTPGCLVVRMRLLLGTNATRVLGEGKSAVVNEGLNYYGVECGDEK